MSVGAQYLTPTTQRITCIWPPTHICPRDLPPEANIWIEKVDSERICQRFAPHFHDLKKIADLQSSYRATRWQQPVRRLKGEKWPQGWHTIKLISFRAETLTQQMATANKTYKSNEISLFTLSVQRHWVTPCAMQSWYWYDKKCGYESKYKNCVPVEKIATPWRNVALKW